MDHQQDQQSAYYHAFYPPDPLDAAAMQQHQQQQHQQHQQHQHQHMQPQDQNMYQMPQPPTAYSYLVPHNPVPIVPSQMQMSVDLNLAYQHHAHAQSGHVTPVTEPTPPPLEGAPFGDASGFDLAHIHTHGLPNSHSHSHSHSQHMPPPLDHSHSQSDDSNRYASSGPASPVSAHPLRYHPLATPSPAGSSSSSRRRSVDASYSDDDLPLPPARSFGDSLNLSRKEFTRRQRIEAEQRRRDELRDGYSRLREVLPSASHKGSKVALLDRASSYIVQLEDSNSTLQQRLNELDSEIHRLRKLNDIIATNLAGGGAGVLPHSAHTSPPDTASLHSELGHLHVDDDGGAGVNPAEIMPPPAKDESFSPA